MACLSIITVTDFSVLLKKKEKGRNARFYLLLGITLELYMPFVLQSKAMCTSKLHSNLCILCTSCVTKG